MEVWKHYGFERDKKSAEDGKIVDFKIGKEEDIKDLTADMAGFGTDQSQEVTIRYDKGYGYFVVTRNPMKG